MQSATRTTTTTKTAAAAVAAAQGQNFLWAQVEEVRRGGGRGDGREVN